MAGPLYGNGVVSGIAQPTDDASINGKGTDSFFNEPKGLAVDSRGNVFVADNMYNKIREISPEGVVTTLAGSGTDGSAGGPASLSSFSQPDGIAVDSSGIVYVSDGGNDLIRKIVKN
jgi:secreted PhoX family phosphatase